MSFQNLENVEFATLQILGFLNIWNPVFYYITHMQKQYYVYIMASKRNGTLYIGVTSDLIKRNFEHRNKTKAGFTSKYNVKLLVYYEVCDAPQTAITREKQLKAWNRKWKLELIEKQNPEWSDLYDEIIK